MHVVKQMVPVLKFVSILLYFNSDLSEQVSVLKQTYMNAELPAAVSVLQEPGDQLLLTEELQGLNLQERTEEVRTETRTRNKDLHPHQLLSSVGAFYSPTTITR